MMRPLNYLTILICAFAILLSSCNTSSSPPANAKEVDVCVYGGTAAGVIAAYSAKMMGKTVILVKPGNYLGKLTNRMNKANLNSGVILFPWE